LSEDLDLRKIVADVAAAYFSNNHVTASDIPTVVSQIATSIAAVGAAPTEAAPAPDAAEAPAPAKATPAQVRKSITRDALISFEDNKPYKTLRRHLAVRDLTPEQYRAKWGLPNDYPMVAPAYSEARASLARSIGLGARLNARTAAPAQATRAGAAAADAPSNVVSTGTENASPESEAATAPAAAEPAAPKGRAPRGAGRRAKEAAPAPAERPRRGRPPKIRNGS